MTTKPVSKDALWFAAGVAVLLLFTLAMWRMHKDKDPSAQLALKAGRVDLVERMQADLASASEAEKSAVLAVTDQDSQTFADQARAASAKVEAERRELSDVQGTAGTAAEKELLTQFTTAFDEFQRIDHGLLALAVNNSNIKAYDLAFGAGAAALDQANAALSRLVASHADAPEAKKIILLAFGAEISALRIQTLLPPHIAEESDKKMDALEAAMTAEDTQVRTSLEGLAAIAKVSKDPDLAAATARYTEFGTIRSQILARSRENTNVRSLFISLNQKRQVMLMCQAALGALQQAILAEPISGTTYGTQFTPR